MFYESWRLIGEDVPRIYYSRIQSYPFENANEFMDEQQLEKVLSERFSDLLKSSVSVELTGSYYNGQPIQFDIYMDDIPIMKNCGNFIEIAPLRDAIYYAQKYSINSYNEYYDPNEMTKMLEIGIGDTKYAITKYDYMDEITARSRNNVLLNKRFIRRLANAVGDRFLKEGLKK